MFFFPLNFFLSLWAYTPKILLVYMWVANIFPVCYFSLYFLSLIFLFYREIFKIFLYIWTYQFFLMTSGFGISSKGLSHVAEVSLPCLELFSGSQMTLLSCSSWHIRPPNVSCCLLLGSAFSPCTPCLPTLDAYNCWAKAAEAMPCAFVPPFYF